MIAAVSFAVVAAATGCSDDTGIIIEVTRDEAASPADLVELVFYVGTPKDGATGTYLRDPSDADVVVLAEGRDLLAEPYRMLLRPSDGFDDQLGAVVVGYTPGRGESAVGALAAPVPFLDGTVTVWPVTLRKGGRLQPTETGCLSWQPEDNEEAGGLTVVSPDDLDCDEDPNPSDCGPTDPSIGHGQPENCTNGIDDNCNLDIDEANDLDGDSFTDCDADCDDQDERIYPGADEACDGVDTDCDGNCDVDADGDGYTSCLEDVTPVGTCFQPASGDCDDTPDVGKVIHPDQADGCELGAEATFDDDCDGACDEDADGDGDAYTSCGAIAGECGPQLDQDIDCNDDEPLQSPGEPEVCDGLDNDCDGQPFEIPEDSRCYADVGIGCQLGNLICVDDEDAPDAGFQCEADGGGGGALVPGKLCEAFNECLDEGEQDPFGCANSTVDLDITHVACTIAYTSVDSDICPDGQVTLPPPQNDPAECAWTILPRLSTDAYEVGLGSDDGQGGISDAVPFCDGAALFVTSAVVFPPEPDHVVLWQHGGPMTLFVYDLTLIPIVVTECPEQPLVCGFEM